MVQVYIKKKDLEVPFKVDEVIILEELLAGEESYAVKRIKAEEKPIKKILLKLINKAKYNPKYLEETISLEEFKRNIYSRNYGIF